MGGWSRGRRTLVIETSNMTKKFSEVQNLPFVSEPLTIKKLAEIRMRFPGQPVDMSYRKEFIKGRGASTKDKTWDHINHRHSCCGSLVPWRHRANCPSLRDDGNLPPEE